MILDFVALAVLLGGAIGVRNTLEPVHNADEIHAVVELFSFTGNISDITSQLLNSFSFMNLA